MGRLLIRYLFLIFLLNSLQVKAQHRFFGMPVVEYFNTEDYQAGIQNYAITQDHRGILYVANNLGLLQYDGSSWRTLSVGKRLKIRSIFADLSGSIYVGSQNDLGVFIPTKNGEYQYESLKSLIPEASSNFDDVWDIYPVDDGYIFTTGKELFHYDMDTINIIPIPQRNDFTFQYRDKLYHQVWDTGLSHYDGNAWVVIPQGEHFKNMQISGILPFSNEMDLVGTYENGLFLLNRHKVLSWAKGFTEAFKEHKINAISRLKDGSFAIGTNTNGLYVLDEQGSLRYHFTKNKGLKNRTILSICEDNHGDIWLGLNHGIAKIEWESPFSYINEELGLPGTGYVAYADNDYYYFGTDNGLFYHPAKSGPLTKQIRKLEGIDGQVLNIQKFNDDILVSCHFGTYQLNGLKVQNISDKIGWWNFIETDHPDKIIAGTYDGLYLLEKTNGTWKPTLKYPDFDESSRVLEFDEFGVLWMTHGYKGVYSFQFSEDYKEIIKRSYYDITNGFPSNILINVFNLNGENIFAAEQGIFSFDPVNNRFTEHDRFNALFGDQTHIRFATEDNFGNIFFISDDYSGKLNKKSWDSYQSETNIFNKIHPFINDDLERISVLDNDKILFAAKDGFIHYDNSGNFRPLGDLKVLIRKIQLSNSNVTHFGGNFVSSEKIVLSQPADQRAKLPYSENSVVFSFAAIDYNHTPPLYRYQLEGFDEQWSDWTTKNEKEYTNLKEGKYTFKVEAKNIFSVSSPLESYQFEVLPPWYRHNLAYVIYAVLILGLLLGTFKVNRSKLNREKQMLVLEQRRELDQRKSELEEVSRKSKEEIARLRNEKLRSEIKFKNKELAATTMHLIDKNDFINSIKVHINDLIRHHQNGEVNTELKRIIKDIEKNISGDDDWSQFEHHFDEVHGDFLKKLRQDYPRITPQEIKLSAYLRMNMSTKEIANLLKISVRGVEIARYRLRKKLGLDKDENLVNYMMNYN